MTGYERAKIKSTTNYVSGNCWAPSHCVEFLTINILTFLSKRRRKEGSQNIAIGRQQFQRPQQHTVRQINCVV